MNAARRMLKHTNSASALAVAVRVAFESKGLKPVFHFIGSRVESPNQALSTS
jgi:hypothetical protein